MRLFAGLLIALAAFTSRAQAEDAVSRGRYLAILGDCAGCHTREHGAAYAGGLPFQAQFGTVYSTNITPDRKTGIGTWTADQFYRALHEGIAADGHHLYPAFPYVYFSRISRRESDELFSFLKTLTPVNQPPTPNKLMFPFNIRAGLIFWNWLYLPKTAPKIDPMASPAWKRGEYIVDGLGHCGACHTPKDLLFGDITSKAFTGGVVDHWYAADLTGNPHTGLGKWGHDDVVRFLATGRNPYATAAGNMQEKVTLSTSHMTGEDRAAIATYLKSLPADQPRKTAEPRPDQMAEGRAIFVARCQGCHQPPGQPDQSGAGPLPDYPKLAGDTLILGRDPATVIRIILQGAESPVTPNEKTTYSMPAFATLGDSEIAAVATYIRNSWGNRAEPVTPRAVKTLRVELQ
jgi:mono/diheme cytochrome c family protein